MIKSKTPFTKVIPIFVDIINSEKALESSKQELALRPDYSLKDNFYLLDVKNRGGINFQEFREFISFLGISMKEKSHVSHLFEKYDRDGDNLLCLEEFSKMLIPLKKEYALLIDCRSSRAENNKSARFKTVKKNNINVF